MLCLNGIIIWLNYNDYMPPHFHAWYGEYKVIQTGAVLRKIEPLK